MTNREYKLTDEMLVELMEAHSNGVEFSAALKSVRIPELLVSEAQDYWKVFGGMTLHRNIADSAHNPKDMFANIWTEVAPINAAAPVLTPFSFISSPYIKQLFAVAGALG